MKSFKVILFLFCITTIFSCWKSEEEIKGEQEKIQEEKNDSLKAKFDKQNEEAISLLIEKYQASIEWDTLKTYTYFFQEKFVDHKQLLGFRGEIKNVIKVDSNYVFTIVSLHHKKYAAKAIVSKELFDKIKSSLNPNIRHNFATFILRVYDVKSIDLKLGSQSESYSDENNMVSADNIETYIDEEFSPLTLFKGELVDYYFNKKMEE